MRPILHTLYVTMLDRIDVDVIDVILQITLVANDVFIKTALPNAAFAPQDLTHGKRLVHRNDALRKQNLHHADSRRKIFIFGRQFKDRVQVIRQ